MVLVVVMIIVIVVVTCYDHYDKIFIIVALIININRLIRFFVLSILL